MAAKKHWWSGREPSVEGHIVKFEADTVSKPQYFPRSKTDGGNFSVLGGKIKFTIHRQHPGTRDKDRRPDEGTVIRKDGEREDVVVTGRGVTRSRAGSRWEGTAFGGVQIFTRRKRSR